jgi:hypothetical protein
VGKPEQDGSKRKPAAAIVPILVISVIDDRCRSILLANGHGDIAGNDYA